MRFDFDAGRAALSPPRGSFCPMPTGSVGPASMSECALRCTRPRASAGAFADALEQRSRRHTGATGAGARAGGAAAIGGVRAGGGAGATDGVAFALSSPRQTI